MERLNFTNDFYKDKALNFKQSSFNHSSTDAFFLLIKDIPYIDLSNLCKIIQQYYSSLTTPIHLTLEECYKLLQSNNLKDIEKQTIKYLAEQCIKNGLHLGNNTINNGNINTSAWISHSFWVSEVCSILATQLGIDEDKAKTTGLLHDYGRKFSHSFNHTIKGFESLIAEGWNNEATGTLTHSFVNGGRCSNNEPAIDGFYVDDSGKPQWDENIKKDDLTLFLENYKYTEYDTLLNIADLMATADGIVSPKDRILDIATRRVIDPKNRGYFLADITNTFINILKKLNFTDDSFKYIKADKNTSIETIQNYFNYVSEYFFSVFLSLKENKKQNSI